jgi:hypothetical protein
MCVVKAGNMVLSQFSLLQMLGDQRSWYKRYSVAIQNGVDDQVQIVTYYGS